MTDIFAFSTEQASRLTGISEHRLRYWDTTGFFSPQYAEPDRDRPFGRLYSFRDLVGLRVLAELRDKHRIPLQQLRQVDCWLREHYDAPWSSLRFYVAGRQVIFEDPETRALVTDRPLGQTIMRFDVEKIANEIGNAIAAMRERGPDQLGRITRQRNVVHNAYVIAGTRIPAESIWSLQQAGYDKEQIKHQYPRLTDEDIDAAINFEEKRQSRQRAG